jgi:very-short-patch-repair endonuclease
MTIRHDAVLAAKLYAKVPSKLEATLALHMRSAGLKPVPEHRFHPPRRWRFDFAFPDQKVGIECEGGIWSGGRHVRGAGFEKDAEKYNQAALDGWTLLRFTGRMIEAGEALAQIEQALSVKQEGPGD